MRCCPKRLDQIKITFGGRAGTAGGRWKIPRTRYLCPETRQCSVLLHRKTAKSHSGYDDSPPRFTIQLDIQRHRGLMPEVACTRIFWCVKSVTTIQRVLCRWSSSRRFSSKIPFRFIIQIDRLSNEASNKAGGYQSHPTMGT
jgi:hypothetical protein